MPRLPLPAAVLALALSAGAAAACTVAPVPGAEQALPDGVALDEARLDAAVLARVNLARCEAGLGALSPAPGLLRIAIDQGRWLAQARHLTHDGGPPGLASLKARLAASGIDFRTGAENIATAPFFRLTGLTFSFGPGPCSFRDPSGRTIPRQSYASLAAEVVSRWLASPGHRRNILDPRQRYSATGAGFDRAGAYCGTLYLAELFAG